MFFSVKVFERVLCAHMCVHVDGGEREGEARRDLQRNVESFSVSPSDGRGHMRSCFFLQQTLVWYIWPVFATGLCVGV